MKMLLWTLVKAMHCTRYFLLIIITTPYTSILKKIQLSTPLHDTVFFSLQAGLDKKKKGPQGRQMFLASRIRVYPWRFPTGITHQSLEISRLRHSVVVQQGPSGVFLWSLGLSFHSSLCSWFLSVYPPLSGLLYWVGPDLYSHSEACRAQSRAPIRLDGLTNVC